MRRVWIYTIVGVLIIGAAIAWQGIGRSFVSQPVPTMNAIVTYDGYSFVPAAVTIKQGGSVTFISNGADMWVASDPHPDHNGYDGNPQTVHCAPAYAGPVPFDECAPGKSFTFTFNKTGSWGYHDHINDPAGGMVIVVP